MVLGFVAALISTVLVLTPAFAEEPVEAEDGHVTSVFVSAAPAPAPAPDPKPIPPKTGDIFSNPLFLVLGVSAAACFIAAYATKKKDSSYDQAR